MGKIVFLLNKDLRKKIFSDEVIYNISEFGQLVFYDGEDDPSADDAKKLIQGADIVITSWRTPRLEEEILNMAPDLKVVIHAAGSVKGIVSPELWQKGIRVSNSAEVLGKGVAETALGMTITALKNMWQLSSNTRKGQWNEGREHVRELFDITIGVVGAGNAGRHYIRLLSNFDVNILLYDPTLSDEQVKRLGAQKVDLEFLLKCSDVVSIHAPSIPATYKMFNEDTLSIMKDYAILINTARGSIIDEEALINELKNGRLFACLDVTEPEPPQSEHPFRTLNNVILTPHIAGAVNNGMLRIGKHVCSDIRLFTEGKVMRGEIKLEDLSRIG